MELYYTIIFLEAKRSKAKQSEAKATKNEWSQYRLLAFPLSAAR